MRRERRERAGERETSTHMRSNIDQMTEKVREWARARACVAKYSDHENTKFIYQKLKEREEELNLIETISYKDTNMIFLSFEDMTVSSNFIKKLEDQNIKSGFIRKNIVRLVIHKDVNQEDLDKIVDAIVHSSSA